MTLLGFQLAMELLLNAQIHQALLGFWNCSLSTLSNSFLFPAECLCQRLHGNGWLPDVR
jgi:hypothetical protein